MIDDDDDSFFFNLIGLGNLFLCLGTLSESILKFACHGLHVTHATGSLSSTSLGLCTPVVLSHFLTGVSTRRASGFLNVVRRLAAPTAGGVRLGVSLTE
jgi:hypothetical protein